MGRGRTILRHRSDLPEKERRIRSRLISLLREGPLVRGTLTTLRNTCGNPNCRCARGEKHESPYLVQSREGKRHARCIPKNLRGEVPKWVERYRQVTELLEDLSKGFWQEVDNHNRNRKPR